MSGRFLSTRTAFALLSALAAVEVQAITRDAIIAEAEMYRDLTYDVDSTNVYPWNHHGGEYCYKDTCRNTVGLGWQTGMAYSYGHWHVPSLFLWCLSEGKGAGSKKSLYDDDPTCVLNHITGIDCSGLVGRAWGISGDKPGTETLPNCSRVITAASLRSGDILNRQGSHVVLFSSWVSSLHVNANVIHSAQIPGYVTDDVMSVPDLVANGYVPRVYSALVDSPVASLMVIGSDSSGTVQWETGWESETEGFLVYRKAEGGELKPVSELIPAVGTVQEGGRYSYRDEDYAGPRTLYRLQEIERSGDAVWLGKTSAADGLPLIRSVGGSPSAAWPQASSRSKVCSITEYPQNWNFEWLAICPDDWVDELAPLVSYRQEEGLAAGTWTFSELASCTMSKPTRGEIRDLLAWALNGWTVKPKYLLLVGDAFYEGGDADLIPMWASYEPELAWYDEDSTWSDRPYADPDDDGETEVFVGRIPATTAADVTNAVAKILEREETTDPTHGKKSLLFVEDSGDCGNDSAWIRQLADSVNACLPEDWSRTLIAQSAVGGTYAKWEQVADSAWSAGQGLVLFFGNCSGWWDFNNFMNVGGGWGAGKLTGNHKYPFVFGASCGEGGIDRENDYGRAVLEQLLCAYPDRGAAGGLLPTRAIHSHTAMRLLSHISDRVFGGEPTLGAAVYLGMRDLVEVFPGGADHVWEYVFFGDPAIRSLSASWNGGVEETGLDRFAFQLERPLPHPISGRGVIRFSIPSAAGVDLKVYDLSGRVVKTLMSGMSEAGQHSVEWNGTNDQGRDVGSGVYFLRLRSGEQEVARKITVLR